MPDVKGTIVLREEERAVTLDSLLPMHDGPIVVCDFYMIGIEAGLEVPGGYQIDRILRVDHHAPTQRMTRLVSSANLALERVRQCGSPGHDSLVVINHTDCDSILSSGIISGRLQPEERFGEAAIAADHTGAEDPIADLLQALGNKRDIELSFRYLELLLAGQPLETVAQAALEDRTGLREEARIAVIDGRVETIGEVAFGVLDKRTDSEFFPALLPDASVILIFSPREDGNWNVKVRLGPAAPVGLTLTELRLDTFDRAFGCRWNAGSNKRAGGSPLHPDEYAKKAKDAIGCYLERQAACPR